MSRATMTTAPAKTAAAVATMGALAATAVAMALLCACETAPRNDGLQGQDPAPQPVTPSATQQLQQEREYRLILEQQRRQQAQEAQRR